jgi:O-antigen/teichoic acid export membrane protein
MLACVVVLPAAWTGTALNALMCYAASSVAVTVWGIGVLGVRHLRPVWPTRAAYRSMLQFSVPLLLTSWAGFFGTNWFDLVVLKWYVPLAGIGMYSLASQLAGVVQQITVIFATLLLPELSVMVLQGQHDRIRTLMERVLPYWLLGTSVLFMLVVLGARVGLPLVFGPSYAGAAPVLALLMVASCALALFNSCTSLVGAFGATWVLTGISFVSTAVNVAMNLVLIPRFGIAGSAMATVLAYLTGGVLILAFVQHRVGGKIVRLAWFTTPVILAYGCFAVFESWWFYPAVVVLGSLNVVALVMVFKLFHAEDAAFFRGLHVRLPFGLGAGATTGRSL